MSNARSWARQIHAAISEASPDDRVLHYLSLAYNLAMSMCKYEHEELFDDLVGTANLALVEAAKKYPGSDAEKQGIPYPAYAKAQIKWALADAMRARRRPVYVSEKTEAKLRKVETNENEEELAAKLGWTVGEVRRLRDLSQRLRDVVSTEAPAGDEEKSTIGEVIPDPANMEDEIAERVDREQERAWLTQAMDKLSFSIRIAISLRFGIPHPSLKSVPADRVLMVASYIDVASSYALQRLRRVRRDERGDLPDVVPSNRGSYRGVTKGIRSPEARQRQRRGEEIWRSICAGGTSPWLDRDE